MTDTPMLIAVAPNGARKSKADHAALPITPLELARTAAACADAGAGMLHLHVRDALGRHCLEPAFYKQALREVQAAVGERLLLQMCFCLPAAWHRTTAPWLRRQSSRHGRPAGFQLERSLPKGFSNPASSGKAATT